MVGSNQSHKSQSILQKAPMLKLKIQLGKGSEKEVKRW